MDEQYVIAYGNPFDGIELIGCFDQAHDANEYANRHLVQFDWWIAALQKPCEEE